MPDTPRGADELGILMAEIARHGGMCFSGGAVDLKNGIGGPKVIYFINVRWERLDGTLVQNVLEKGEGQEE